MQATRESREADGHGAVIEQMYFAIMVLHNPFVSAHESKLSARVVHGLKQRSSTKQPPTENRVFAYTLVCCPVAFLTLFTAIIGRKNQVPVYIDAVAAFRTMLAGCLAAN